MKRIVLIALLVTGACTVQQENGNQISFNPPVFMRDQSWEAGPELVSSGNGERKCSAIAGGDQLLVTQQSQNNHITQIVSTKLGVDPGNTFKVIIGNHSYETPSNSFNAADSATIIEDMLNSHETYAYTELSELVFVAASDRHRENNKIPLASFPAAYASCQNFVQGAIK